MMATRETERAANIERIEERIRGLETELSRAGKFRLGTPWYEDRARELASMRTTLARLEAPEAK